MSENTQKGIRHDGWFAVRKDHVHVDLEKENVKLLCVRYRNPEDSGQVTCKKSVSQTQH